MDATVLGRIGYDLYAEEHDVPLREVRRFVRALGGSSANIAVGLSRLGLEVGMIGCVGDDALSHFLVDFLRREKVSVDFVTARAGYLSSLCFTEVSPPDQFPQVFYRENAADTRLEIGNAELEQISESRLFVTNGTSLCASPSRESTLRALEEAHDHGVTVAFDVDYREMSWPTAEEASLYARLILPFVDILIANPRELGLVARAEDTQRAIEQLSERGIPMLVAKLGDKGTRVITPRESLFLPPYPVEVTSTIGAGDGFAAGFLYAMASELPLKTALKFGNAAAAIVVSRLDCSEAMPYLKEIEQMIAQHDGVAVESL